MAGMATPEQMAELAASDGTAFDRLFRELMIPHHEGAVKMVKDARREWPVTPVQRQEPLGWHCCRSTSRAAPASTVTER